MNAPDHNRIGKLILQVNPEVKNEHPGFAIPYRKRNIQAKYFPDFIVVLENGLQLMVEIKGRVLNDADIKTKAAERWVRVVNALGEHGRWHYLFIEDPQKSGAMIAEALEKQACAA
ncbi:MAG: hypothetical protein ACLFO5_00840 [Opitutales bacterium]